jgi:putative oxidoreductase
MTFANLVLLVLRLVLGLTYAAHGAQKAFGWWNGPGLRGWQNAMARMNFRPAPLWAAISIGAELGGGLLLALGLLTPLAAALLVAQSVVIILKVHLPNGFWNSQRGIEFPLTLAAGVVAVLGLGPGSLSLDRAIGFTVADVALWGLLALALVAGVAVHLVSTTRPALRPAPDEH